MRGKSELKCCLFACLMCLVVYGCTITGKLYSLDSYTETVSSILTTNDGKTLAVLTPRFHYIFSAPQSLVSTVNSGFSKAVKAEISDFVVDENNKITGVVSLTAQLSDLSADQKKEAYSAGFARGIGPEIFVELELSGIRYESGGLVKGARKHKLTTSYRIIVKEPSAGKVAKVLLTPITLAADGALNLGRIALLPFALIVMGSVGP